MRVCLLISIWLLSFFSITDAFGQTSTIPAFPGAEGFGKYTTGGRGGKVYIVTNLNDSGPGSLREAIEAIGPRIVVFNISGTIELKSLLNVREGNLTIAGQTAPGDGVTLKNFPLRITSTNNVIIRYIRVRLGDLSGLENDAFVAVGVNNMIIDHCSFSWGTDETCSIYSVENVTVQNSIISEGLHDSVHSKGRHGYGGLIGGAKVSLFKNLMAHFWIRMPSRSTLGSIHGIVDMRENVFYNWGFRATDNGANTKTNLFRNYYKPGPASGIKNRFLNPTMSGDDPNTYGKFYLEDNYMPTIDLSKDQWLGVRLENTTNQNLYLENCKNKDLNGNLLPFEIPIGLYSRNLNAQEAYTEVLTNVGASLVRDAVDERLINEVKTGTTTYKGSKTGLLGIIDSQNDVGGWPELKSLPAPKDTDRDGMPDEWEIANGLDPNKADDRGYNLSNEYTNIEVYINSLVAHINPIEPTSITKVTGITSTPSTAGLDKGKTLQISATVSPSNASNKKVIWTSSNTSVATVNTSGLVTAVELGSATITAKTEDGEFTAKTEITVKEISNPFSVESFTLINAGSNTPIAPLKDGDELNFEDVQHLSLNFRANTNPVEVGSVHFSLEGPVNSSRIDNGFTYDLLNNAGLILPVGNYRLTAIPYMERNGGGAKGKEASILFSIIASAKTVIPEKPILSAPINKSIDLTNSLEFQWEPTINAVSYTIQLSEKPDFSSIYIHQSGLESPKIQINDLKSGIQYFWRVSASNEAGNSPWSDMWSFSTKTVIKAPSAPTLLGPENLSTGLTGSINLKWSKPENAKEYRVQISKDAAFTTKQFDLYNIPTESFEITNLEAGTTFYWRVNSSNEGGSSAFSEAWKFETLKGPDTPKLISPSDGQSEMNTSFKLVWDKVLGADSYRIQVSTTRDFTQKTVDLANIHDNQFQLENLAEGKTYFWRVRATNLAGNSSYSATWSFSTKISLLAPSAPTLLSPESGTLVNAVQIPLEWYSVENAEKYEIQISTFSNFSQGIAYQNSNLASNKVLVNLDPDKIYFWRVRAINQAGTSPYSQIWSLNTKPIPPLDSPILLSPKNGVIINENKVEFIWGTVQEATSYNLQIATELGFNNIIVNKSNLQVTNTNIDNFQTGTFYWRVIATGNRPQSQSEVWSLTIEEAAEALAEPLKINVFPNPFRDFINVEFSKMIEEDVYIILLDNKGKAVIERQFKAPGALIYLSIPQGLANGPYNLRIQSSQFVETRKVIKK